MRYQRIKLAFDARNTTGENISNRKFLTLLSNVEPRGYMLRQIEKDLDANQRTPQIDNLLDSCLNSWKEEVAKFDAYLREYTDYQAWEEIRQDRTAALQSTRILRRNEGLERELSHFIENHKLRPQNAKEKRHRESEIVSTLKRRVADGELEFPRWLNITTKKRKEN